MLNGFSSIRVDWLKPISACLLAEYAALNMCPTTPASEVMLIRSPLRWAIMAGASAVAAGALFAFTASTPKGAAEYLNEQGVEVRID